jgi:ABC-type multidrug transport system ATPase subunit
MGECRVRAEGLMFGYRVDRPVLDAIDLEAWSGDVVGLLGRNGSGKTTLLRLLSGLLRPTSGTVETASFPGVVSDRTPFLDPLTARENLLGTLALRGVPADEAAHATEFFLRCYGLATDADRPVSEFSLGMRRRLALAEGFASNQELVLLDEPTLGLDPAGRERLIAMLGDHSNEGLTAVLATNDAAFAEAACDRVLLLHAGRIAAQGSPSILVAALGAPTVLEVTTASVPPAGPPPDGLALVARGVNDLSLSGVDASRRLPEVWAWLESAGCPVREVKIREPDLGDVFRAHTGEELSEPPSGAPD